MPFQRKIAVAVAIGSALSLAILFYFRISDNSLSYTSEDAAVASFQTPAGVPLRLTIPAIGVDAKILSLGLTAEGNIGTPKGPSEVSWYSGSPRPGENGSAVISGHYGWKDDIPAAFDNLSKLKTGDTIYVKDQTGTTTAFRVSGTRIYAANADASDVFATSTESHLNLITCSGDWNPKKQMYANRLVVFANKVE